MVFHSVTSPRGEMAAARVLRTRGGNSLHVRVMPWTDLFTFDRKKVVKLGIYFSLFMYLAPGSDAVDLLKIVAVAVGVNAYMLNVIGNIYPSSSLGIESSCHIISPG